MAYDRRKADEKYEDKRENSVTHLFETLFSYVFVIFRDKVSVIFPTVCLFHVSCEQIFFFKSTLYRKFIAVNLGKCLCIFFGECISDNST